MEVRNLAVIGIDAGGTMIKLAYEEKGRIHFRKYTNTEMDAAMGWLKLFKWERIALTGSQAAYLQSMHFPDAQIVSEFDAVCNGAKWLHEKENPNSEEEFLLVNMGTGTSWFHVKKTSYKRILGSGIGGGTIIGLSSMLANEQNFSAITDLAAKGKHNTLDLLVKDLYNKEDIGINGNLTASNFGKGQEADGNQEDGISSLFQMVAETIVLLTQQASTIHQVDKIVYAGGAVYGNKPLQKIITSFDYLFPAKQVFLQDGQFCGAIGAFLAIE